MDYTHTHVKLQSSWRKRWPTRKLGLPMATLFPDKTTWWTPDGLELTGKECGTPKNQPTNWGWPVNLFMVIFRTIYYWVCQFATLKNADFEKSKPVWKNHSSDLKAPGPFDPTPDYIHMVCLNMGQSHHWSCSPFQWSYLWVPCHMFGQPVSYGCLYIPFHCIIYYPSLIPLCIYIYI